MVDHNADPLSRIDGDGKPPSRILVTGAAGFIGSHLCDRLLERGHRVWGLDNFDNFYPPETKRQNLAPALRHPAMRLVEGDIRDGVLLDGLLSDIPFDAVVHLAARPGVRPSIEDPNLCFDVNVTGTLSLLEAMRRWGPERLVFGSSSSVYGEREDAPFAEETAGDRPISPYATSKRTGEMLCYTHHHLYDLSVLCLRFFTVFGPRQRPDLAIHKFARLMAAGEPLPLYGDGSSSRDYTFVDDVVEGIRLGLGWLERESREAPAYDVVNVGRSDPVTLSELVRRLARALEIEPLITHMPEQPGDVSLTCASDRRVRELLGYAPEVDLDEGLRRFASWFWERTPRKQAATAG
jgi:UDP-glucuronate 4-epimerase